MSIMTVTHLGKSLCMGPLGKCGLDPDTYTDVCLIPTCAWSHQHVPFRLPTPMSVNDSTIGVSLIIVNKGLRVLGDSLFPP